MRFVRFFLKALGALLAVVILAIVALDVYPHTRPAPKTVRAVGTISIPAPFQIGRSFIDYLTLGGSRLYAGYASHGMVGVIDIMPTILDILSIPGPLAQMGACQWEHCLRLKDHQVNLAWDNLGARGREAPDVPGADSRMPRGGCRRSTC
jgi:hypothetical protein